MGDPTETYGATLFAGRDARVPTRTNTCLMEEKDWPSPAGEEEEQL